MERTIEYKGIKEIRYRIGEYDLNKIITENIRNDSLFVSSKHPIEWGYEWCETDQGGVYIEVTCKIIEKNKPKPD